MGTVDDWIDACRRQGIRLRRRGQEHCGPCPICQTGDDRFWIKPGHVQPVLARCRHGHTYGQLHRMLLETLSTPRFRLVRPPPRPNPPTPHAPPRPGTPADSSPPRTAGQPTYFRQKFPESDRLVWTYRDMWLVPLKPFAQGQLLRHPARRPRTLPAPPPALRTRDLPPLAPGGTAPAHRRRHLRPRGRALHRRPAPGGPGLPLQETDSSKSRGG